MIKHIKNGKETRPRRQDLFDIRMKIVSVMIMFLLNITQKSQYGVPQGCASQQTRKYIGQKHDIKEGKSNITKTMQMHASHSVTMRNVIGCGK